jgi:hypothetical protein
LAVLTMPTLSLPCSRPAHRGDLLLQLVELVLHAPRAGGDRVACLRQAQLAADQLGQRQAAILLQRLQLHRHGRLREMAHAGRGRDAAQARHLLEHAQLAQRDAFHGALRCIRKFDAAA